MKKLLLVALLFTLAAFMYAATVRAYTQEVVLGNGNPITAAITNTGVSTAPGYVVSYQNITPAHESTVISTATHAAGIVRLVRIGVSPTWFVAVTTNLSNLSVQWYQGDVIRFTVTKSDIGVSTTWDWTIPDNANSAVTFRAPNTQTIPPLAPAGFAPYAATGGTPNGTGIAYGNNVTLGWTASAAADGTHSAVASYDVYYGVGSYTNGPLNVVAPAVTLAPFAVLKNTTYMCKVVAKNEFGNAADLTWTFTTRDEKNPNIAQLIAPANDPTYASPLHIPVGSANLDVLLDWDAPAVIDATNPAPTSYALYVNSLPVSLTAGELASTSKTVNFTAGHQFWQVVPTYTDPGTKKVTFGTPVEVRSTGVNSTRGDAVGNPIWHFDVVQDLAPTYDIPNNGTPTAIEGTVTIVIPGTQSHGLNFNNNWNPGNGNVVPPPAVVNAPMYFSLTGTGTITFTVNTTAMWGSYYQAGQWHTVMNTNGAAAPATIVFVINFDGKGEVPIVLDDVPPTLPVELSSFTAVLTAEYFVNLTWVTESETQVLGFNVYRSENSDFANAVRVNATSIPATNTSSQATYTMEDREVETNATYYYWLENVDMGNGSALHGPQSVTVTGDPTPVLPEISMLNSAYPNPFRAGQNTNINVSIKAGETGTVTVYNILGQSVKSFKVNEGAHTLKWDGKDCGSGIYFYKLTTPTTNATKKLVIVK